MKTHLELTLKKTHLELCNVSFPEGVARLSVVGTMGA
jgi:hypothetical protein